MIPFPKFLTYGNIAPIPRYDIILDIDFSKQNVGDTFITDFSDNRFPFTVYRGTPGVVEFDTEINSNVLRLNSGCCYYTPKQENSLLSLQNMDFEIIMTYKSESSNLGAVIETGNYTGSGRTGGLTCLLNQNSKSYYQYFFDVYPNSHSFFRAESGGTNTFQWETMKMTYKRNEGLTVYNERLNISYPFTAYPFSSGGKYFSIGGDYVHPSTPQFFIGSIKRIQIRKLEE